MRVLLIKCHKKTIFSRLEPIVTEPLELEYIAAVLNKNHIEYRIYDSLLELGSFDNIFEEYKPDILGLSGYITAVDVIREYAEYAKKKAPSVKVVVGGVHAEVNFEDFFTEYIDVIVHSDGVNTFEKLMKTDFDISKLQSIDGIAFRHVGDFVVNKRLNTAIKELPLPDRSYFYKYQSKTKYLNYGRIALVKGALSCPFDCSFCYCKLLNMGMYASRTIEVLVEEISDLDCEYVWIVDDSFLIERSRVINFIKLVKEKGLKKKFIAYSRVDFIVHNEDLIEELSGIGLIELIAGMEAVEDSQLEGFNKRTKASENIEAVRISKQYGINLTALFIADISFTKTDFIKLRKWIDSSGLNLYTLSIFTPMKGTKEFHKYRDRLITKDFSKWDFLHLVIRPDNMSVPFFYFQFYLSYVGQFFKSSAVRKLITARIKNLFTREG